MNLGFREPNQYRRARGCPVLSSGTLGSLMFVSQLSKEMRSELAESRPTVIVIDNRLLVRTCIVKALQSAMLELEVLGFASIGDLSTTTARDVRLVVLHMEPRTIDDPVVQALTQLENAFPRVPLALIADGEDAAMGAEALRQGVKGFLTTSTPLEVTIAAIRLLLAGGAYCPQLLGEEHEKTSSLQHSERSESSISGINRLPRLPPAM
jgi:DNA-binding NarL/FixJ family response regulator